MSDFTTQPAPTNKLAQHAGEQSLMAPPPPSLGGPPQTAPMGTPMGVSPQQGPVPGMSGAFQGAAALPPPSPQAGALIQGAQPGMQPPSQGMPQQGQMEEDELDEFVNQTAQAAQQGLIHPKHLTLLQQMKATKDMDPQSYWLLFAAGLSGDLDTVLETAMHLRDQKAQKEMQTQQQLLGVAAQRSNQRVQQQYRNEDREDRQVHQQQMRGDAQVNTFRESIRKDGKLERVEQRLGRQIQTPEDMQSAQTLSTQLIEEDKDTKAGMDYVKALNRGPQPMAGRIKARYDKDENFRNVVDETGKRRDEWDALKKENLKQRTLRTKQVRAAVAHLDPAMKLYIMDLQRQLTEAESDEDAVMAEYTDNTAMAKLDAEDQMGYRGLTEQLTRRSTAARSKADGLRDTLNEALATIGAPTSTPPKRTIEDKGTEGKPAPQKRDYSRIDSLLGQ